MADLSEDTTNINAMNTIKDTTKSTKENILKKYPVIFENPDFDQVVSNFTKMDYLQGGAIALISFPIGYIIGKPFRGPSLFINGILGSLGGFLLAYQNSAARLSGYGPNDEQVNKYLKRNNEDNNNFNDI